MPKPVISYGARKALEVQLGEEAGREIASLLQQLADAVAALEKKKVDVTPIAPLGGLDVLSYVPPSAAHE